MKANQIKTNSHLKKYNINISTFHASKVLLTYINTIFKFLFHFSIAKKAWDCQAVMTSQCTPLQHYPVMHAFYSFAAKDSKYCGYPLEPTKDQLEYLMMSPYYNLTVCVGEVIKAQHEAWLHPTPENFAKDCKAAVELDNCVFHQADWSPMAKVARQQLAEMTAEVKRVACMAIPASM